MYIVVRIVDHKNTKCCKSGKNETYIKSNGRPVWFKDRDKYDNWTRKYVCYNCYNEIGKPRTSPEYFTGRMCCKCGIDLSIGKDHGLKYYDEKGSWTKEWLCSNCYAKDRQKLSNSQDNIIKSIRNIRTGNLDKNTDTGKSVIDQAVVSKVLGFEDLNIKFNNFNWYIDLDGNIDVKSSSLQFKIYKEFEYDYYSFYTGRKRDCSMYICLGYDINRECVENVWIIPNNEYIINKSSITITKNSNGLAKYEDFRVDNKLYNFVYQSIMRYLKDKKYFGVEDIKEWLKGGI